MLHGVRAAESLMKLVADVKQYLILNDFPSVNEAITQNSELFRTKSIEADKKLLALRDDMAADLFELGRRLIIHRYTRTINKI
ncbi:Mediator of RNA polymerase II transcription subunit 22 [Armadillidium vulgare]|nr:Mediator of RNA polymerase II transcription subunit 22 [Armadillidium vulgare]